MTAQDFIPIAATLQTRWWAFPIPPSALDGYVEDLQDLDIAAIAAAVDSFVAEGADRPPTSGMIRRRVAELELDAPTWDEVRTELVHWRADRSRREVVGEEWACPDGACDGTGMVPVIGPAARTASSRAWATMRACTCRQARLEAIRGWALLSPLVREFVTGRHVDAEELTKMLSLASGDTEARVRGRWREFVGRAVDSRVFAAIPAPPGIARLDAARREDHDRRSRGGDLRRVTPLAMLPRAS